jgi:hypothetical protein
VAALLSINGGLRFLITAVVVTTSAMFSACLLRGALPTVAWGILAFEFDRSHSKNRLFESAISINVDDGRAPILALLGRVPIKSRLETMTSSMSAWNYLADSIRTSRDV